MRSSRDSNSSTPFFSCLSSYASTPAPTPRLEALPGAFGQRPPKPRTAVTLRSILPTPLSATSTTMITLDLTDEVWGHILRSCDQLQDFADQEILDIECNPLSLTPVEHALGTLCTISTLAPSSIVSSLNRRILELEAELAADRTVSLALAKRLNAALAELEESAVPDPEPFDGTTKNLRPFLAQLRLRTAMFPDQQSRLRFAVSVLRDQALDQVLPFIEDDRVNLFNLDNLISILTAAFGNPNHVADAEHRLNTIDQGTRDFSSYFAEFQRHAAEVSWNDEAKLSALRRGLSYQLKQDLIAVPEEPQTITDLVTLCQRMDNRRRALKTESKPRPSTPAPPSFSWIEPRPVINVSTPTVTSPPTPPTSPQGSPDFPGNTPWTHGPLR